MSCINPNPVRKPYTAANITDATAAGRGLLTAANVGAQRTLLELGTAALSDDADFATAAQGALADSAVQPADIGTAAAEDVGAFATAAQGDLADSATQPGDLATVATSGAYSDLSGTPTLGTAAATDAADYATAAQGALADSATQPGDLATVATSGSYDDLTDKPTIPAVAKVYYQVALSPNGAAIASGTGKGFIPITVAGTITAFSIDCDPANEPSAAAVQVDLNTVDRSTGVATSVLSAVASIATSANTATGTISGTPTVSVGDWLQLDIDQGSDGQDLIATVEITPS